MSAAVCGVASFLAHVFDFAIDVSIIVASVILVACFIRDVYDSHIHRRNYNAITV